MSLKILRAPSADVAVRVTSARRDVDRYATPRRNQQQLVVMTYVMDFSFSLAL